MSYKLKTLDKEVEIELSDNIEKIKGQAEKDYSTSKTYIDSHEKYIWRAGYKSYHMSTYDRKIALGKDANWRQNVSIGLTRAFVDVLIAAVNEKPLTFIGTGINKAGIENKQAILDTLKYVSDATGFHTQLKKTMRDGLITGEICMRVGYKKTKNKEKIISIIDGKQIEETIDTQEMSLPYATNVSIFNVFPDPYTGPLRYVTERGVIPYEEFIETFGHLIRHTKNKSPLAKYIEFIVGNEHGVVDKGDYGNVRNQIHQKRNEELRGQDFYLRNTKDLETSKNINQNYDEDTTLTKDLIEFKITWYKSRIVLLANNYPVYIGDNIYGFIPYVIKSANGETRFGEGIPYLTKPLEDVGNSFINNYFDSARSIAQPTFVVNKNLLVNDKQLQDGTPGGIVYMESTDGQNAVYRLDKGGLNDFNIIPLIMQLAQQITGISEYNLGQSAGERTASGALAVTQSSQKRLSPYISNFLDAISEIAYMWLALIKKFWVREQFIYVLDENGNEVEQAIKNKNLIGAINLSLAAEGMFGSINELELQKLISLYQTLAPSGFITSPEIAKEIIKKAGFEPSKFIIEEKQNQIKPDNFQDMQTPTTPIENPNLDLGQIIQQTTNPQINLGNQGQGQG